MVTKEKATETAPSFLDGMEVVDHMDSPLRGRGFSPEIAAIRTQLEACLTDGKARSIPNVPKDKKEDYSRKIRAAGAMRGKEEIRVSTRFFPNDDDANLGKLVWGPYTVLQGLSTKK